MSASEMEKPTSINTSSNLTTENIISSNAEMIDLMKMFVEKMDDFIDAQSDSNGIQTELLQYSKA
jgi:undecaprenyl pyrophosphate synthase